MKPITLARALAILDAYKKTHFERDETMQLMELAVERIKIRLMMTRAEAVLGTPTPDLSEVDIGTLYFMFPDQAQP